MKINLAKIYGFCFGVKRAIKIAKKELKNNKEIFILKDLVHNEEVMRQLKKMGIKKIKSLKKVSNKTLLICAHGETKQTIQTAKRLGYKLIDATCPMVKHIHKIVQDISRRSRKLIVIGDRKHQEVKGIIGQSSSSAIVIDPKEKLNPQKFKGINSASIVVQSTQDLETAINIKNILSRYIPDLEFFNTICEPTQMRQEEVKELSRRNDLILIIGCKKSANTRRLYQISRQINKRTYWINNPRQIKLSWFKNISSVGITAGASTPESSIRRVIKKIREIS